MRLATGKLSLLLLLQLLLFNKILLLVGQNLNEYFPITWLLIESGMDFAIYLKEIVKNENIEGVVFISQI